MREASMSFVLSIMNSLAETTMDFMLQDPTNAEKHCRLEAKAARAQAIALELARPGRSPRTSRTCDRFCFQRRAVGSNAQRIEVAGGVAILTVLSALGRSVSCFSMRRRWAGAVPQTISELRTKCRGSR
jgi:hypothetical protein